MDTLSYKTVSANKATVQKGWVVVDAEGQILGRMCSKVAKILRGKYKPNFTPNVDCGDNVIIINAAKVELTGNKWNDRVYVRYTGHPGGQREFTPADLMAKGADKLVRKVVKGMLPKNRLGAKQIANLYIFEGATNGNWYDVEVDNATAFRYLRYIGPATSHCNINEMEFYDEQGRKIEGTIIGTEGDPWALKEKAFDGDIVVALTNVSLDEEQDVTVNLEGAAVQTVSGRILTSANVADYNDFENPDRVAPADFTGAQIEQGVLSVKVPAKSLVVLTLK